MTSLQGGHRRSYLRVVHTPSPAGREVGVAVCAAHRLIVGGVTKTVCVTVRHQAAIGDKVSSGMKEQIEMKRGPGRRDWLHHLPPPPPPPPKYACFQNQWQGSVKHMRTVWSDTYTSPNGSAQSLE